MPDLPAPVLSIIADVSDVRLAALTRDLCRDLGRSGLDCQLVETATHTGARGDGVTLGQLALTFISSGAAVAMIECLKAYFVRERSLVVRIKHPDRGEIEVNSNNVGSGEIADALRAMARRT